MANREPDRSATGQQPTVAEVREELERVLASSLFGRAGRSRDFLRFVVEETLAGRAERLKGYTIGVEVFGRPHDFDAQADPLVRVEAGRLRRRLTEYYYRAGRDNPMRITLASGGYAPAFASVPGAAPVAVAPARSRHPLVWRGVLGGALVAIVAVATWAMWDRASTTPAPPAVPRADDFAARSGPVAALGPRMLVLPFANLSGDPGLDSVAGGTTEETIRALVSYNIFATASTFGGALESAELSKLRNDFHVGYVLAGSVRSAEDRLRVTVRLMDTEVGTQLWTQTFDEVVQPGNAVLLQEHIGETLASALSSPFGPVYANEIGRMAARSTADLDPYGCLLRFYEYARYFDPARHVQSRSCLERAVLGEPRFAPAWSALAVVYLHEQMFGYDPQPDSEPALTRALEAVRTSLDIDGSGRVAAVALAGIWLARGDDAEFHEAAERALAISPKHPALSMLTGYLFAVAGDWQRGVPLLDDALPLTPNVPGWANVAYAFRYLQTQDYEQALDWSLRSDAPDWFVTSMTVAASAALAGREDIAEREVRRLLELYPDFERTGREQLGKWHMDAALLTTLLDGLRLAGLQIA